VYDSNGVEIRDVGINRSGFWSLALIYSGHVTVDGLSGVWHVRDLWRQTDLPAVKNALMPLPHSY